MVEGAAQDARVVCFGSEGKWVLALIRDAEEAMEAAGRADVSVWCASPEADEADETTAQNESRRSPSRTSEGSG